MYHANDAQRQVSLGNRTERFNEFGERIGVVYDNRPASVAETHKPTEKAARNVATHVFDEATLQARIQNAKEWARLGKGAFERLHNRLSTQFAKDLEEKLAQGYRIDWSKEVEHMTGSMMSSLTLHVPESVVLELEAKAEAEAREQYAADVAAAQAVYMESELARRVAEHQETVRREREQAEAELADVLMREIAAELETANTQPAPASKKTTTKSKTV